MNKNTKTKTSDEGTQSKLRSKAEATTPLRGEAKNSSPASAGAVLRRTPDPDQPGSWRVAPLRLHSSIVDTMDRPGLEPQPTGKPNTTIVDTMDGDGDTIRHNDIVDTMDGAFAQSAPRPIATRIISPSKSTGPVGPDQAYLRKLREANKRLVADRARARGRDPGADSTEVNKGVTRSKKTHEHYLERGQSLVRRYRKETGRLSGSLHDLEPVEFTNWFFSLKPTLKPTAWRPYRQAAKAILSTLPHDDTDTAIAMIDADITENQNSTSEVKQSVSSDGDRNKLPRRTSSLKEKRFPKSDFDTLVSYLRHFSRSKFAPALVDWMIAGISTGLRPIEWAATEMEIQEGENRRQVWLYVLNAKSTNGRANGLVRTLEISDFDKETLSAIGRMSRTGSQWLIEGSFDSMQSQCSQLLYSVCEKLFKGRKRIYSLYSLRHQFIANAKSFHNPASVSALAGHIVTETAVSNYGKKRSAWEPEEIRNRAQPVAEEVASVRQQQTFYEERIKLQQEAGLIKAPKISNSEDV